MIEEEKIGTISSKAWCKTCRETLSSIPTEGEVSGKARENLEYTAVVHERRHPKHEVTVILYKAKL